MMASLRLGSRGRPCLTSAATDVLVISTSASLARNGTGPYRNLSTGIAAHQKQRSAGQRRIHIQARRRQAADRVGEQRLEGKLGSTVEHRVTAEARQRHEDLLARRRE